MVIVNIELIVGVQLSFHWIIGGLALSYILFSSDKVFGFLWEA